MGYTECPKRLIRSPRVGLVVALPMIRSSAGRLPTAVDAPVAAVGTYLAPGMHFPVHPATRRFQCAWFTR